MNKKLTTSVMLIGFIFIFLAFLTTSNFAGICIKEIEYYILFIVGISCIIFSLITGFDKKSKKIKVILIILILLISFYLLLPCPPQNFVISSEGAKNQGCQKLLQSNCNIPTDSILIQNFDANRDGKMDSADTLFSLCEIWYFIKTDLNCKKLCGCP